MADFKLTYSGRTVTFPGWNGYVVVDDNNFLPYMIFQLDNTAQNPVQNNEDYMRHS